MSPEIRRAETDDAGAIAVLNEALGRADDVERIRDSLACLCVSDRDVVLIALTLEGTALGWIHAGEREVLGSGRRFEILGLVVREEARARGVGRRLVAGVEDWATARGLSAVVVRSNTRRAESHPFYERLGYHRTKTQHVYEANLVARPEHEVSAKAPEEPGAALIRNDRSRLRRFAAWWIRGWILAATAGQPYLSLSDRRPSSRGATGSADAPPEASPTRTQPNIGSMARSIADGERSVHRFDIRVPDSVLDDLRSRIRATRWAAPSPAEPWQQGTDLTYLRGLLASWADDFDWPAAERRLNELRHLRVSVDDVRIHAVHAQAADGHGIPLILSHGWPSTFLEYLPLVPLLTDPAAHGIDGPSFDLVIPSLPGYAFSERPARTGVNYRVVAAMWHRLMAALGYERYGAGGTDFGAGVSTWMALDDPGSMIGLYVSTPELRPYLGPGSTPLTPGEAAYVAALDGWDAREGAYRDIQATKPQTLAYGLTDSPAGLAAWVVEKWRSWAQSGGDPEVAIARDELLTMLTILWATGSITTSIRDYYDNRWFPAEIGPETRVTVPTAIASFPHAHVPEGEEVREWADRLYDVRRWTRHSRGGHFSAIEAPELYARDVAAFFGSL